MNISSKQLNKNLYKIFLSLVKYTPIMLSIVHTLGILTNYLGIHLLFIHYIGGLSIIFLIMLFIMSYVFKFCYLYRIPLWYLTTTTCVSIIDSIVGIPISTINMFRVYAFNFGIFIITFVVYMYKNRNKPKVDYIKQMCENYTKCCS